MVNANTEIILTAIILDCKTKRYSPELNKNIIKEETILSSGKGRSGHRLLHLFY